MDYPSFSPAYEVTGQIDWDTLFPVNRDSFPKRVDATDLSIDEDGPDFITMN